MIGARLADVETSVNTGAGDAFKRIFQANEEIGRGVRENPGMKRDLLELQLDVNAITISLKAGDTRRAVRAVEVALARFFQIRDRHPAQKNL